MKVQAEWLTREVLLARLIDIGVEPNDRLIRGWREAGLLPRVDQISKGRAGSITLYPAITVRQIAAIVALKRHHRNSAALGWELWWQGYEVDEKYWLPELETLARVADRVRRIIPRFALHYRTGLTFSERVKLDRKNPVTSRLPRRMSDGDEAAFIATSMEVTSGEFDFFRDIPGDKETQTPEMIMLRVHDLVSKVEVNGRRLNHVAEFPRTLAALSSALSNDALTDVAKGGATAIQSARDDVRLSLEAAADAHAAFAWIFGPRNTGLRHVAWLARKGPRQFKLLAILGFAALRKSSYEQLESREIEAMAADATRLRLLSNELRRLGQTHPSRALMTPKAIRAALADHASINAWCGRLKTDRIEAYSAT